MVPFANKENGNENNSLKIFLFIPFFRYGTNIPFHSFDHSQRNRKKHQHFFVNTTNEENRSILRTKNENEMKIPSGN